MLQVCARKSDDLPSTVQALTPGLLVFFDRPSRLQSWAQRFGQEWRHVGITIQTDEGLMIANFARTPKYHLLPLDILANYRRIGVARVFTTDDEIAACHDWFDHFADQATESLSYSTTSPIFGSLHLYARSVANPRLRRALMAPCDLYCSIQNRRYRHREAFICSTFAWATVRAARRRPLRVPMTSHPEDEVAYATPQSERDDNLARWFCAPGHLWAAVSPANRADIVLDDSATIESAPAPKPRAAGAVSRRTRRPSPVRVMAGSLLRLAC